MGLNIKNEETHRLVKELAELTGETQVDAVAQSVRERLDRVRQRSGRASAEELLEIGRQIADRLSPEQRAALSTDDLYDDELGLPK